MMRTRFRLKQWSTDYICLLGSGMKLILQAANKDILLTQVKDDFDSPSMSVKITH